VLVGELLRRELGFRLQANAKTIEGKQHPDRDAQFRYINQQVLRHQRAGQPTISIDAKKKELIGQFSRLVSGLVACGVVATTARACAASVAIVAAVMLVVLASTRLLLRDGDL
jgi:hypothetical protein